MNLWRRFVKGFYGLQDYLNLGGDLDMSGWFEDLEKEKAAKGAQPDLEYRCEPLQPDLTLLHYQRRATSQGWTEADGHPVEWLLAKTYRVGYEDAVHRDGRVLVNAQLLSEAATAIQVLAERQSDSEAGVWWSNHYGTLAGEFRRMLAKAHKSKG